MKKFVFISFMITAAILSGCGNNAPANTPAATDPPATTTIEPKEATTPQEAVKEDPTPEPTEEAMKELTETEQLSLDFVNVYLNGDDAESKKKFATENVHDRTRSYYESVSNFILSKENKYQNVQVVESKEYSKDDINGTITLIKSDNDKEIIVLVTDGKISWGYISSESEEALVKVFTKLRSEFK